MLKRLFRGVASGWAKSAPHRVRTVTMDSRSDRCRTMKEWNRQAAFREHSVQGNTGQFDRVAPQIAFLGKKLVRCFRWNNHHFYGSGF